MINILRDKGEEILCELLKLGVTLVDDPSLTAFGILVWNILIPTGDETGR